MKMQVRKATVADYSKVKGRGRRKKKKTPSLYDIPVAERSYWGNDPGTDLIKSLIRLRIISSVNRGEMFDFQNNREAGLLDKDAIKEMRDFEISLMKDLFLDKGISEFKMSNNDGVVVIEFDRENNKLYFRRKES